MAVRAPSKLDVTCNGCGQTRRHCCHGLCHACYDRQNPGSPRRKCAVCGRRTKQPRLCYRCTKSQDARCVRSVLDHQRPASTHRHGMTLSTLLDPRGEECERARRVEIYADQFERHGKLDFADPRLHAGPAPVRYVKDHTIEEEGG